MISTIKILFQVWYFVFMDFVVEQRGIFLSEGAGVSQLESKVLATVAEKINKGSDILIQDLHSEIIRKQSSGRAYRKPGGRGAYCFCGGISAK